MNPGMVNSSNINYINNPFLTSSIDDVNTDILNSMSGFNTTNPRNFTATDPGSTEFPVKSDIGATSPLPIVRNKKVVMLKNKTKSSEGNMTAYNLPLVINSIADLDRMNNDREGRYMILI